MPIIRVLAAVAVADIDSARSWYNRLLGRPPDAVPMDSLACSYEHYCQAHGIARYAMHRPQLGQFLSRYYEHVRMPRPNGGGPRGWAYRFGPIEEARARFSAVQNIDVHWRGRS